MNMLLYWWAVLKEILLGLGFLALVCFLVYCFLIYFIAAWRSKYLKSIDRKLDRLLDLLGDKQDPPDDDH